jgi:hypothetical protein
MQSVPSEIFARIGTYASLNGARTTDNLRLVSRDFRLRTSTIRFRAIAAVGHDQLEALVRELETASPEELASVRHVFLCDRNQIDAEPMAPAPDGVGGGLVGWQPTDEAPHVAHARSIEALFTRLLELCSPTIKSLVFIVLNEHASHLTQVLTRLTFPSLEYLSYSCVKSTFDTTPNVHMPCLRTLMLDARLDLTARWSLMQRMKVVCPSLQTVSLDGVDVSHNGIFLSNEREVGNALPAGVCLTVTSANFIPGPVAPEQSYAALSRVGVQYVGETTRHLFEATWKAAWLQRANSDA